MKSCVGLFWDFGKLVFESDEQELTLVRYL